MKCCALFKNMSIDQPKISVIVPIHNAGEYLIKCLDSLVSQTLCGIEIILVLDCPTDGSDKVAISYADRYPNIQLIFNKEGLHTGLSRNEGLKIAKGEYIGFLDHDDFCTIEMYRLLYEKAKSDDLDVVRCDFSCVYFLDAGDKIEPYKYPQSVMDVGDKQAIYKSVCDNSVSCVIWNHIYKLDFLKKHNLSFLDSRTICSEDSIFFIKVYEKLRRVGIVNENLYFHTFHLNNTGKAYNYRSIKNRISFFEELYIFLRDQNVSEENRLSFLSENVIRSLYTASRQALLILPMKKAAHEISQVRGNKLMMKCVNYIIFKDRTNKLLHQKATVILFSFIMLIYPFSSKKIG